MVTDQKILLLHLIVWVKKAVIVYDTVPNGRASFNFIYSKYKQEVMEDKQVVAKN